MMKTFFLLMVLAVSALSVIAETTLREIRWQKNETRLTIRFTFDQVPLIYPAFYQDSLKRICIDFTDTRLSQSARPAGRAPFPLDGFSVDENVFDDNTSLVRVTVSVSRKPPYTLKSETPDIVLELDITPLLEKQLKLLNASPGIAGGNGLASVTFQSAKQSVELLFHCLQPVELYPLWLSTDKKKLCLDLIGMTNGTDVSPFEKGGLLKDIFVQKEEEVLRWTFQFASPITAFSAESRGSDILLQLEFPPGKEKKFVPKKWMVWSAAGAAVLTTGVILLSGGSKKPGASGGGDGGGADDWNDNPPTPP